VNGSAGAAVLLAAAAGTLLPRGEGVLGRLRPQPSRPRPTGALLAVVGLCAALATVGVLPAVAAGVAGAAGWRVASRRLARRSSALLREQLGELLAALRAELRSGADPRPAMAAAATGLTELERLAVTAASPAGDVRAELTRLGSLPGGRAAADLAAAWQLAELTGCRLADPVDRVMSAHRVEERLRRELAAQLAGPTATARLLTALPAAGVAMGAALGTDPVGFLLGSGAGRACLVGGLTLLVLGARWTHAMTRAAGAAWTGGRDDQP
jgi:tight adherence protein B